MKYEQTEWGRVRSDHGSLSPMSITLAVESASISSSLSSQLNWQPKEPDQAGAKRAIFRHPTERRSGQYVDSRCLAKLPS
jgi:hypothetical protein